MSELDAFRAEKDEFFGSHPQSPLTREQKKNFQGLKYFPENDDLRLEVQVIELSVKEEFDMQTSTGGVQHYQRFGKFSFLVEGQTVELTIYRGEHGFLIRTTWEGINYSEMMVILLPKSLSKRAFTIVKLDSVWAFR